MTDSEKIKKVRALLIRLLDFIKHDTGCAALGGSTCTCGLDDIADELEELDKE